MVDTENNIYAHFCKQIGTLLNAGAFTATVFTSEKQVKNVAYSGIHGAVHILMDSYAPLSFEHDICGAQRQQTLGRNVLVSIIVLGQRRNITFGIANRITELLQDGKFVMANRTKYFVRHEETRRHIVDPEGELYSILMIYELSFYRKRAA